MAVLSDSRNDDSNAPRKFDARGVNFELEFKERSNGLDPVVAQYSVTMAGYAFIMIIAISVAWTAMEVWVVRRVLRLTERTRELSRAMKGGDIENFSYSDLGGKDELGVLATGMNDLLRRISEDVYRERVLIQHQGSVLRAIGHEIRSPLQSLSAVFAETHEGLRYVRRMLRAVKALYGDAAPSSGIEQASVEIEQLNLTEFLESVAKNSALEGVDQVSFENQGPDTIVRADPSALEDVFSHILSNANRYRSKGTTIRILTDLVGLVFGRILLVFGRHPYVFHGTEIHRIFWTVWHTC